MMSGIQKTEKAQFVSKLKDVLKTAGLPNDPWQIIGHSFIFFAGKRYIIGRIEDVEGEIESDFRLKVSTSSFDGMPILYFGIKEGKLAAVGPNDETRSGSFICH
jgi:hypothetical protein